MTVCDNCGADTRGNGIEPYGPDSGSSPEIDLCAECISLVYAQEWDTLAAREKAKGK